MFRGKEIPQEMKDNDLYEYITFTKLDPSKEEDKKLVHDYWTKLNETDEEKIENAIDYLNNSIEFSDKMIFNLLEINHSISFDGFFFSFNNF